MAIKSIALTAADIYGYVKGGPIYAYGIRPSIQAIYHLHNKTTNVTNIAYNILSGPCGSLAVGLPPIKQAINGTANLVERGTRCITKRVSNRLLPRLAAAYSKERLTHALRILIPYVIASHLCKTPIQNKPDLRLDKLDHFFIIFFSIIPALSQYLNESSPENSEKFPTRKKASADLEQVPTQVIKPRTPVEIKKEQTLQKRREQIALNLLNNSRN